MTHMFTLEGEAALASALACSPLLAFDFDGTLAPIVTDPDDARIPAPVARRLDRLASLLPVAIITGRAVADVRERLTGAAPPNPTPVALLTYDCASKSMQPA